MLSKIRPVVQKCKILCFAYAVIQAIVPSSGEKNICELFSKINKKSKCPNLKTKIDIFYCNLFYDISPKEYILFHFPNINHFGRLMYIGDREIKKINYRNCKAKERRLQNKYLTYQILKPYYGRDIIKCDEHGADIDRFLHEHSKFVVKPLDKGRGRDVYVFNTNNTNKDSLMQMIKEEMREYPSFLLEEYIEECGFLRDVHPDSVNTVRIVSMLKDKKVTIAWAVIRIGTGSSVVDNLAAGGIGAAIDVETGIIVSKGYTEDGDVTILHPDTNLKITGVQLPEWNKAIELVSNCHQQFDEYLIIGWDLSYTKSGWIIVEGNGAPSAKGIQICMNKGMRNVIVGNKIV